MEFDEVFGVFSGLAAFGGGLCLIGVGIALHVLAEHPFAHPAPVYGSCAGEAGKEIDFLTGRRTLIK